MLWYKGFTGITGTLTAMDECTVCFYLVKLVLCGCIKCLIKKVTVTIYNKNTWWTWNLWSLNCCVFKDNFCYKMFCWGVWYCFQEIIHMYFPLQAPLVSTVTFLVQMNTVYYVEVIASLWANAVCICRWPDTVVQTFVRTKK